MLVRDLYMARVCFGSLNFVQKGRFARALQDHKRSNVTLTPLDQTSVSVWFVYFFETRLNVRRAAHMGQSAKLIVSRKAYA